MYNLEIASCNWYSVKEIFIKLLLISLFWPDWSFLMMLNSSSLEFRRSSNSDIFSNSFLIKLDINMSWKASICLLLSFRLEELSPYVGLDFLCFSSFTSKSFGVLILTESISKAKSWSSGLRDLISFLNSLKIIRLSPVSSF